jgi:predicted DNA binding CopG/RHH family protein
MKKMKLTPYEKRIEKAIERGEYVTIPRSHFEEIAHAVARRRKEATLSLRINQQDLNNLKQKAKHFGVPYQSFISEILHRHAL